MKKALRVPRIPYQESLKPKIVKGSADWVRQSFGGFGPESPEYDKSRRLTVTVPHPESTVKWFEEVSSNPSEIKFTKKFTENDHPKIKEIEVCFNKHGEDNLVTASIKARRDAAVPGGAPIWDDKGNKYYYTDVFCDMRNKYLRERLQDTYGDSIAILSPAEMRLTTNDGIQINIRTVLTDVCIGFDAEADVLWSKRRLAGDNSLKTLKKELTALQEHLPIIAEAYADFFRTQLPKSEIIVDYKSEVEDRDPINPFRLKELERQLVVDPADFDFKYIGGLEATKEKMEGIELFFKGPVAFERFGVTAPRGVLLQGPPGVGKTALVMSFAKKLRLQF